MTTDLLQPGELVRLKRASSLGELPVVRVLDGEVLLDTGLTIDGHLVPVGYPAEEVIREEDWPAYREQMAARRDRREREQRQTTMRRAGRFAA